VHYKRNQFLYYCQTSLEQLSEQAGVYAIINLPLKPDRQIPAMLEDTVLVAGLEKTADNVCIISVCPHVSL
jgi:hypothetical protein